MIEELQNKIKITKAAVNHLKGKNKPFAMIAYPDYRSGGESVFIEVPDISNKEPKGNRKFNHVVIDGIDVYLGIDVKLPETEDVLIDLDTFLGLKFLKVSGFSTHY